MALERRRRSRRLSTRSRRRREGGTGVAMAITLAINGRTTQAVPGVCLFDLAESLGVQVPTSCRKQGKCKECMVEVIAGMELLSPPTEAEEHLKDNFRLSCQTCAT